MNSQGKRIVVLDLTAFPFLQTLNKENTDWITLETYIKDSKRKWGDTIDQQFYSQLSSRMPSEESIYTIKTFAQETGEAENLTELDIMLMALVYDIEKENNDVDHINKIPLLDRSRYFENTDQLREVGVNVCAEPCLYFSFPGGCSRGNGCFYRHPGDLDNRPIRHSFIPSHPSKITSKLNPNASSFISKSISTQTDLTVEEILTPVPYQRNGSHVNGGDSNLIISQEQNEDLNEDWVGSTDLASFDINVPQQANKQRKREIMCCTTNFSIQCILLQMGFHLLSVEDKPITKLKIWTRKCSICFRVCRDESRVFCPFCGNRSLKRVQAFINNHGIVGIGDFPYTQNKPKKQKRKNVKKT